MSDARRGLPLLSGPPPSNIPESESCRKCGKEFNVIFTRSRKCNHCGYLYCHSCSDYQALMPRVSNGTSGYDVMNVCGFCIDYLTISASGKTQLKSMQLGRLKKYANAYNIRISHAVEKDDVIEALLSARGHNGCLSTDNENYYRRHSVPSATQRPGIRSMFRTQPSTSAPQPPQPPPRETRPTSFARPDLEPDPRLPHPTSNTQTYSGSHVGAQPHPSQVPRPNQHWGQYPGQQPYHQPGFNPGYNPHYQAYSPRQPPPPPPQASRPPPTQRQAAPPPPPRPPPSPPRAQPPPVPSLDELINMDSETIGKLSISVLKSILFTNHVAAGQVLEKGELVRKVIVLVDDERRERERQQEIHDLEEMIERAEREQQISEEVARRSREGIEQEQHARAERAQQRIQEEEDPDQPGGVSRLAPGRPDFQSDPTIPTNPPQDQNESDLPPQTPPKVPTSPKPPAPPPPKVPMERSGLCVVCQDDEANIAIVDCGHLCMCRGCSDLIMSSSRECPLCRTRIVTEARLLRIFKS